MATILNNKLIPDSIYKKDFFDLKYTIKDLSIIISDNNRQKECLKILNKLADITYFGYMNVYNLSIYNKESLKEAGLNDNEINKLKLTISFVDRYNYLSYLGKDVALNKNISTCQEAIKILQMLLHNKKTEHFCVMYLDRANHIKNISINNIGQSFHAIPELQQILLDIEKFNPAAIIIAHNHPSLNPEPSNQDDTLTKNFIVNLQTQYQNIDNGLVVKNHLKNRLENIILHDHIIIAGNKYYSYAMNQKMNNYNFYGYIMKGRYVDLDLKIDYNFTNVNNITNNLRNKLIFDKFTEESKVSTLFKDDIEDLNNIVEEEKIAYKTKIHYLDKITEKVKERLQSNNIEEYQYPWVSTQIRGIYNFSTGNKYHGALNNLNIFIHLYFGLAKYPLLAGFEQIKEMKGSVKAGSKGVNIFFPMLFKDKEKNNVNDVDKNNNVNDVDKEKKIISFNSKTCFFLEHTTLNVDEVILKLFPNYRDTDHTLNSDFLGEPEVIDQCKELVKNYFDFTKVQFEETIIANPVYSKTDNKISMPLKKCFYTEYDYYSNLFHEMAHSTCTILNREANMDKINPTINFKNIDEKILKSYNVEEFTAELTSLYLSYICGIPNIENKAINDSVSYINSWLQKNASNDEILKYVIKKSIEAADYILNLNNNQNIENKEENVVNEQVISNVNENQEIYNVMAKEITNSYDLNNSINIKDLVNYLKAKNLADITIDKKKSTINNTLYSINNLNYIYYNNNQTRIYNLETKQQNNAYRLLFDHKIISNSKEFKEFLNNSDFTNIQNLNTYKVDEIKNFDINNYRINNYFDNFNILKNRGIFINIYSNSQFINSIKKGNLNKFENFDTLMFLLREKPNSNNITQIVRYNAKSESNNLPRYLADGSTRGKSLFISDLIEDIPPIEIKVFESPIDLLSYCALKKNVFTNCIYIATMGQPSRNQIENIFFIAKDYNIKKINLCFDNDNGGLKHDEFFKNNYNDFKKFNEQRILELSEKLSNPNFPKEDFFRINSELKKYQSEKENFINVEIEKPTLKDFNEDLMKSSFSINDYKDDINININ